MKFMEDKNVGELNSLLRYINTGECKIFGKLEVYTCKNTSDDRKLKSHFDTKYIENASSESEVDNSVIGPDGKVIVSPTTNSTTSAEVTRNVLGSSTANTNNSTHNPSIPSSTSLPIPTTNPTDPINMRRTSISRAPAARVTRTRFLSPYTYGPSSTYPYGNSFSSSSYSENMISIPDQFETQMHQGPVPTDELHIAVGDIPISNQPQPGTATFIRIPSSPFGPITNPINRKTFFYLISTLNASYPDYDFSDIKPEYFTKVPDVSLVMTSVNHLFHLNTVTGRPNTYSGKLGDISRRLWTTIDGSIELKDCEIFSFNPDPEIEPDGDQGGHLWSFYYFFFNRRLKRLVFLACRAMSILATSSSSEEDDMEFEGMMTDREEDTTTPTEWNETSGTSTPTNSSLGTRSREESPNVGAGNTLDGGPRVGLKRKFRRMENDAIGYPPLSLGEEGMERGDEDDDDDDD